MRSVMVAAVLIVNLSAARADTSVEPYDPELRGQSVACSAFRPDGTGGWTALRDVPVQRQNEFTTVAAGTSVRAGGPAIAGLDVGGVLDQVCPR